MLEGLTIVYSSGILIILALIAFSIMGWFSRRKLIGKHVFITGGSKGIGLAVAQQCVMEGCHVSIVSRNESDLATAVDQLQLLSDTLAPKLSTKQPGFKQRVTSISADICNSDKLKLAVIKSQIDIGQPIDIAICNAGMCIPGLLLDQDISIFQRQLDLNLLANIQLTKLLLPEMLSRKSGHLVYVSSPLAVMGFAGYSSYCPSKWAMRGFADALRNEVQGTGVEVSVAYPPDTDTPGFAQENESKPEICVKVNDSLGVSLYSTESVAKAMVRGLRMKGRYHLPTPDLGSGMLIAAVAGLTPKPMNPVLSVFLAPILVVVTSVCRVLMDRAARKCNVEKKEKER